MASFFAQIDSSFLMQAVLFIVFFFLFSRIFFTPFSKLFEARHKRMIEDRKKAEKMASEARQKLEEYETRLNEARVSARNEFDQLVAEGRQKESEILGQARAEVKKITQNALLNIENQKAQLRKGLEAEVDAIAEQISEKLLIRKN